MLPDGGPETLNCTESLGQIERSGPALTMGKGLTVTATLEVLEQPLASVPVIIYEEDIAGLAVTVVPLVEESPVEGLHE